MPASQEVDQDKLMAAQRLTDKYISVPQFYAERSIFITGGTGFMGKVNYIFFVIYLLYVLLIFSLLFIY